MTSDFALTPTTADPRPIVVRSRPLDAIDPTTLYRILWLRSRVFFGEQGVTEEDLDGRELEPSTVLVWAASGDDVVGHLRILDDGDTVALGRVVTDPAWRQRGVGALLVGHALDLCRGRTVLIHAQSYLERWYGRFGFVTCGQHFEEAGIDHVPMVREASGADTPTPRP